MTSMNMATFFCHLALAAYFASSLVFIGSILTRRVHPARIATWIFTAAFAAHTLTFPAVWLRTGHMPVLTIYDGLSFFSWAMAGAYLLFQLRTKTRVLGAFISPVSFVFLIIASMGLGNPVSIPDILKSGLVSVHAILAVIGEALFAVASLAGLMYLIQDNLIKYKKTSRFIKYFPSLRDLDRINHASLLWGFPLLTLGILAGSLWAGAAWGKVWQWDPRFMRTFLAWAVYALLLHQRLAIGWRGHKAALFSVVAFVLLFCAFLVEQAFFTTIHNFFK
jgi:cytochrome c-type biogenesis protein CcsB